MYEIYEDNRYRRYWEKSDDLNLDEQAQEDYRLSFEDWSYKN
jgi:hypothetical protein